jgi:hypothetical protein
MAPGDQSPRRLTDVIDRVVEALNRVRYPFGRRPKPTRKIVVLSAIAALASLALALRVAVRPLGHAAWEPKMYWGMGIVLTVELGLNAWGLRRAAQAPPNEARESSR